MTMTEPQSTMVTVFHACKAKEHADKCTGEAGALVTEKRPPSGSWNVLYELHVPRSAVTGEGKKMAVQWATAERWPMQISTV